jgi:hypothetical protein
MNATRSSSEAKPKDLTRAICAAQDDTTVTATAGSARVASIDHESLQQKAQSTVPARFS